MLLLGFPARLKTDQCRALFNCRNTVSRFGDRRKLCLVKSGDPGQHARVRSIGLTRCQQSRRLSKSGASLSDGLLPEDDYMLPSRPTAKRKDSLRVVQAIRMGAPPEFRRITRSKADAIEN